MLCLLAVVALASCSGEEDLRQEEMFVPINFVSETAETEAVTRANTNLGRDFVVYGYKKINDTEQPVFNGYSVTYSANSAGTSTSNTHNYEYVHGDQTIKYWDFGASEYSFWAYTGAKTAFNADGTTLTINDLALTTTEPDVTGKMFSSLYHRSPVTTNVVQLQFLRPYAKVRVMFYTSEELTGSDQIKLTGISFGGGENSISKNGCMTITYPKSGSTTETVTVTGISSTIDALSFDDATLDKDHGTASNNAVLAVPTGGTDWYYAIPLSTAASAQSFTMQVSIDGNSKTATVPADYMHWNPNTAYTYIFKITEAGKKIEFYDVKIDPWEYGGSQEEEWKNW